MISKSNNNSDHDSTSAFFQCFFPKKNLHLNPVENLADGQINDLVSNFFNTKDTNKRVIVNLINFAQLCKRKRQFVVTVVAQTRIQFINLLNFI